MKEETSTVLGYLECEGSVFLLRNQLLSLSASHPAELQQTIISLLDAIKQTNIQSHKHAGFYYLFLGCAYFEQSQYQKAVTSLHSATTEMWNSQVNKALTRWLLGLCHSNLQDFPKTRNELQEALQLLATHIGINSSRTDRERRSRQTIRKNIKDTYERLFNEPLFRDIPPDPVQSADHFIRQNPPTDENDTHSISFEIPISVVNENYPSINIPVTVTNQPVNNFSFASPPPDAVEKIAVEEHKNAESDYANHIDNDGYLVIQSIPVYEEFVYAGNKNGPELHISTDQFAEFHQVSIDGKPHTIHSLKSNTKQVKVNKEGVWSWLKVKGKSMNAMKGNVSIKDGDYILFQSNSNANNNDIVIAIHNDITTDDSPALAKRLRESKTMLYSETTEKGAEYEPINIKENNMKIAGIVYAVAKPIPF